MTRPRTFQECLADRRQIRKRGGVPPPIPPDLEPARAAFETAVLKSVLADDPDAALAAAIQAATDAVIAKAFADVTAEITAASTPPPRPARPTPTPAADVLKGGGNAWSQIETGAATLAGTTPGRLTKTALAQAVSAFLETADGKKLYTAYLAETDAAAAAQARQRRTDG